MFTLFLMKSVSHEVNHMQFCLSQRYSQACQITVAARKRSCFHRCLSCQSFYPQGGLHVSITYDALDMGPAPHAQTPNMGTTPLSATDIWWTSLETCSHLRTYHPPVLTSSDDHQSGWYAFHWNAFLVYKHISLVFVRIPQKAALLEVNRSTIFLF